MALNDQDPELSEAGLEAILAERGLHASPSDRQGILAVARFLHLAAARLRRYESEADNAAGRGRHQGENDEAGS